MNTTAGHSSGHPRMKMTTIRMASRNSGVYGQPEHEVGQQVARVEPGEHRAVDVRGDGQEQHQAGSGERLAAGVQQMPQVSDDRPTVSSVAPSAPMPAASVGVAMPTMMLPRAENMMTASGTMPEKNSRKIWPIEVARSSGGSGGPSSGFRKERIIA